MWQCSALLVSCVLAAVLGDTAFDGPREYIERIRSMSSAEVPYRRPVSRSRVSSEVKRAVPNRRVSESVRGARNIISFGSPQYQDNAGQNAQGLVVESTRLNIKVPPSRKYYNPALKKVPFPFELPVQQPYPFQDTTAFGLDPLEVPTGSGLQFQDGLLPTAAGFQPTAIASLPTSIGALDFTSPGFVADSWRSYQQLPITGPSAIPNFSTRPPWIPRPGKTDFKPQRGNLQTGSAPGNMVGVTGKLPSITSGNVSELIKMVEQLIIASNQNNTNTNNTIPAFKRLFKHPSVG